MKKILTITLLTLTVIASLGLPKGVANAGLASGSVIIVGADVPQTIKEYVVDTIVNAAVNVAVGTITKSITDWANSGFEGKPTFSQNFVRELEVMQGDVIEQVLNKITLIDSAGGKTNAASFICSPFSQELQDLFRVQLAISRGSKFEHSTCTVENILKEVGYTMSEFENDFAKGGWPAWLELTTNPVNNRYGSYINIQQKIWSEQEKVKSDRNQQLDYGSGFLSMKEKGVCLRYANSVQALPAAGPDNAYGLGPGDLSSIADEEGCVERGPEKVTTPGQTIQTHVAKALGLSEDRLLVADEVNEMIGALATAFVKKIFSAGGSLFGASDSTHGDSLTSQLQTSNNALAKSLQDRAAASAEKGVDNAQKIADGGAVISELRDDLAVCLAELASMQETTVNVDVEVTETTDTTTSDTSSDTTTTDSPEVAQKRAECEAINNEIKLKQEELRQTLLETTGADSQAGLTSSLPMSQTAYTCYDLLGGQPATRNVTMNIASITTTKEADKDYYKVKIVGNEVLKYYKKYTLNFDVRTGPDYLSLPGSVIFTSFGRADYPEKYAPWFNLGTKDYGHKLHYDPTSSPGLYRAPGIGAMEANTDYHFFVEMDAEKNSFHVTATKLSAGGTGAVGSKPIDFYLQPAHAAPDIIDSGTGLWAMFGTHVNWTYSNIRINLTAGGPFQGGAHGCPVTI